MALPRQEPFQRLIGTIREQKRQAVEELCLGRWDGEAAARALVGRIKAYNDMLREAEDIGGPGTRYAETNLLEN